MAPSDEGAVTEGDWGRELDRIFSPSGPSGHLPHQREALVRHILLDVTTHYSAYKPHHPPYQNIDSFSKTISYKGASIFQKSGV